MLAQCQCDSRSNLFYADSVQGSPANAGAHPTGQRDPAWCRFATVGEALAAAGLYQGSASRTVSPVWTTYPVWQPTTAYRAGDAVVSSNANGRLYESLGAGKSGPTEPNWPGSGGTVADNSVTWRDLRAAPTPADRAIFSQEAFPLVVPSQTALIGACLTDAGLCDTSRVVLVLNANLHPNSTAMIQLAPNTTLGNLALVNSNAPANTAAISCDSGTVNLTAVALVGQSEQPMPRLTYGLRPEATCLVNASGVVVGAFEVGILMTSSSASLTLSDSIIGSVPEFQLPGNTLGIDVKGGTVKVVSSRITGNTSSGISLGVPSSATAGANIVATLSGNEVTDNNIVGLIVAQTPPASTKTTITGNKILRNGSNAPESAGVVFQGYSDVAAFSDNSIAGNKLRQIAYRPILSAGNGLAPLALGGNSYACGLAGTAPPNHLYCYGANGVGIETQGSALAAIDVTRNFIWHNSGNPQPGRDYLGPEAGFVGLNSNCPWTQPQCPP